jgi:exopolyphosphatase/pppGpp-phosphohydrolase
MTVADIQSETRQGYHIVRSSLPPTIRIGVLHIAPRQTAVALGDDAAAEWMVTLAIGWQAIADGFFKHTPATAIELENAIAIVEDEIARARPSLPDKLALHTADAQLREIARLSGIAESAAMVLSRDAMEQTFELLVAVAAGRPAAQSGLPTDNEFAARLLILREIMHHLQFSTITCHDRA